MMRGRGDILAAWMIICIRTNNVPLYKQAHAQYEDIHNRIQSFKGHVHITMESINQYDTCWTITFLTE